MKKIILLLFISAICLHGFSATVTINNSGLTFTPSNITIKQGDNVNFVIGASHNAVEVSQEVWNASGNSPVVGFSVPFGGGMVPASQLPVGIHYYVCTPHASLGMKGIITVETLLSTEEIKGQNDILLYPNPVKDNINIEFTAALSNELEIKLFDLRGQLVDVLLPKTVVSGLFSRSFPVEKLTTSGVYIISFAVDGKLSYKRVVIL